MKCPQCGLFHPSRYEQCVSCGTRLTAEAAPAPSAPADVRKSRGLKSPQATAPASNGRNHAEAPPPSYTSSMDDDDEVELTPEERRQQRRDEKEQRKGGFPGVLVLLFVGIVLACAGGTYCFLTKPPEFEVLLTEGKQQLANGQFAFAQKTLDRARMIKPQDPRILLSLARAYVGIDQVEKAWSCITEAQQQGMGVMTDPQLSSDLANYYRQRNQYGRAADLLRPLAEQNLPKKKAELSDLLALWGDEAFRKGNNDVAVKCWEDVKELKDGQRFSEADSRLASIYLKIANEKLAKGDEDVALDFFNKLNNLAPSPQTYERTSDIYARQGKLDLSIDQLRRALKSGSGSIELNKKLAGLLAKRGRELLDKGDSDTGYAYLQQAQGFDNRIRVPNLALRNISISFDPGAGGLRAYGNVWNPTGNQVNYLAIRADLFDTKTAQVIWRKDQRLVDEFMPPMGGHETRPFDVAGPCPRADGLEVKLYIDNTYYGSYPVKGDGIASAQTQSPAAAVAPSSSRPVDTPPTVPAVTPQAPPPQTAAPVPQQKPPELPPAQPAVSPEERTLQDLD